MIRITFCFFSILIVSGCYTKNRIPGDIIPKRTMQAVMTDVILSESMSIELNRKDTTLKVDSLEAVYLTKVLSIHKISKNDFDKSYKFYSSHPMLLKEIIDSIQSQQNVSFAPDTTKRIKIPGKTYEKGF